jgi:predicted nicotinamide N-methyase
MTEQVVALRDGEIRLLRPRDSESLLDEDAFAENEFMPYWAELWPSGEALARRLSGRALRGARVVELGCGLGLPSMVAARAGARVLATDWSDAAVSLLRVNARANEIELQVARVDWSVPDALVAQAPFDLVLAADVLYEQRNVALLLALLPRLGDEIWLADPGRAVTEGFLAQAPSTWSVDTIREQGALIHQLTRVVAPV